MPVLITNLLVVFIGILGLIKVWSLLNHYRLLLLPTIEERRLLDELNGFRNGSSGSQRKNGEPTIPLLPFGYQDFKLRDWVNEYIGWMRWLRRSMVSLTQYPALVILTSVLALWSATPIKNERILVLSEYSLILLVVVIGLLSALMPIISTESAWTPITRRRLEPNISERLVFLAVVLLNWITSVSGTAFCAISLRDFHGLAEGSTPHVDFALLVNSAYFAASTFTTVGFGDINATRASSRAFVALIELQTFVVVGMLLSSVLSARREPVSADSVESQEAIQGISQDG